VAKIGLEPCGIGGGSSAAAIGAITFTSRGVGLPERRDLSAIESIDAAGTDVMTVREARALYFAQNGLSEAGYSDRWVKLRAGPLPLAFPNTRARVRAVKLHDLHHVATGYDTTWRGEAEIGAWELAAGCGHHLPAWVLNLGAVVVGLLIAPGRTLRAWRRGRRSRTLYAGEFDPSLLDMTVPELRARLGLVVE
jgi:hypothetical protein